MGIPELLFDAVRGLEGLGWRVWAFAFAGISGQFAILWSVNTGFKRWRRWARRDKASAPEDAGAARLLATALSSEEPPQRRIEALQRLRPHDCLGFEKDLEAAFWTSAHPGLRNALIPLLLAADPATGSRVLARVLASNRESTAMRLSAARALSLQGPAAETVPLLRGLLQDAAEASAFKAGLIEILGTLNQYSAARAVVAMLASEDEACAAAAEKALAALASPAQRRLAVKSLAYSLTHCRRSLRFRSRLRLLLDLERTREEGEPSPEAAALLLSLLRAGPAQDPLQEEILLLAIEGAAELGLHEAVPELLRHLEGEADLVRQRAALALGLIGDERAREDLRYIASFDFLPSMRKAAAAALEQLRSRAPQPSRP